MKDYIKSANIAEARTKFSLRTKQLRTVRSNQANNREFAEQLWQCSDCQREGQSSFAVDS